MSPGPPLQGDDVFGVLVRSSWAYKCPDVWVWSEYATVCHVKFGQGEANLLAGDGLKALCIFHHSMSWKWKFTLRLSSSYGTGFIEHFQ